MPETPDGFDFSFGEREGFGDVEEGGEGFDAGGFVVGRSWRYLVEGSFGLCRWWRRNGPGRYRCGGFLWRRV